MTQFKRYVELDKDTKIFGACDELGVRIVGMPDSMAWTDYQQAIDKLDTMISWLLDLREYTYRQMDKTPRFSAPVRPVGIDRAFNAEKIVQVKQSSLRTMAIMEVRALTVNGQLYTRSADDLRWNQDEQCAQVRVGGEWISVTRMGLELWATEEGLNILNGDGTITLCFDALPADVGGGGGVA